MEALTAIVLLVGGAQELIAAQAAWGQLNAALTVATIDFAEAVRGSYKTAKRRPAERGEDWGARYAGQGDFRGRCYEKRAVAEDRSVCSIRLAGMSTIEASCL